VYLEVKKLSSILKLGEKASKQYSSKKLIIYECYWLDFRKGKTLLEREKMVNTSQT